jgi:tagatose-6-phosphate ketose/aldose isomerase
MGFRRAFFLASRPFVGGAHEAQLKVQELSGGNVVAKAEDSLGFRHGFMAAVDAHSLVVLYLSGETRRRRYELDLLAELKAKGLGKCVVAVADNPLEIEGLCDFALGYGGIIPDDARALPAVLFGQLLGFHLALASGLKPDNPSPSGVINRVVQGVTIHPWEASEESPFNSAGPR